MSIHVIEVVRVVQTCVACPSQWDAWTVAGEYIYIRYRLGRLTVDVNDVCVHDARIGGYLDGCMTWDELLTHAPIRPAASCELVNCVRSDSNNP